MSARKAPGLAAYASTLPARIDLADLDLIVTHALPVAPTVGQDAERMVRHGLADVLAWLGEPVGPAPGEPLHAIRAGGLRTVFVSPELAARLKRGEVGP